MTVQESTILIVDDAELNIDILVDALDSMYDTSVAMDGETALETAREIKPALILLDIMMPGMDGYEVCRRLKANPLTKDIPVIFLTARTEVENKAKGFELGCVDYITKPFDVMEVKARVKTHLDSALARAKISALLDNSGQGFLSFGADLLIDAECSQECKSIFGQPVANHRIDEMLYPVDEIGRRNFARNIGRILAEADDFKRSLYISLMPAELQLNGKYLRAEYKILESGRLMLILTNVTNEKELETEVRRERERLKLIVTAVREAMDFFDVLEDFEYFHDCRFEELMESGMLPREILMEYFRRIHTFKGLFQQLCFIHLPAALHKLEAGIVSLRQSDRPVTIEAIRSLEQGAGLLPAKKRDLEIIEEALGRDFLERRSRVTITKEQAVKLEALARRLLGEDPYNFDAETMAVLRQITCLRSVNLKTMLAGYPKACIQLAERLGKQIHPFTVEGDDIPVNPDHFGPFVRALVHVFRNAVDHGIELPDERVAMDKDETGTILCTIARRETEVILTISDDGRGFDMEAMGLRVPEPDRSTLLDMIFNGRLPTRNVVSDLSGRGIGLCAVKTALDAVGGRVEVETSSGQGTLLRFVLPVSDE